MWRTCVWEEVSILSVDLGVGYRESRTAKGDREPSRGLAARRGGARQAREDRVGKPAHTRSVRCRKSCDAPVGEQTQQAGRGSGSTHESGDGARTEGLVIAATTTEWCQLGGGPRQTDSMLLFVGAGHAGAVGNDAGVLMLDWD